MNTYKITILTVSFNQGKFIEDNILSVFNQTYNNIEHIVIDGGSTDNTLEVLSKYKHLKWISEKDNGQSDAYNKGLKLATGDLVLFLNSDDYLLNKDVLEHVTYLISEEDFNKYSAFVGNLNVVDVEGNTIGYMNNRNRDYYYNDLLNKIPVVIHPSTFFVNDILKQTDGYSKDIHYVMDYDICLKTSNLKPIHSINIYTSALRRHENSKGESKLNWKFSAEFIKIRRRNNGVFLSKLNMQPLKILFYKFVLGESKLKWLKQSSFVNLIVKKVGLKKINKLTWYE